MIEVRVHEDRVVLLHHLAELGRDALGQVRGDAAPDANDLDVRNRAQLLEQVLQPPIAQHHRIAATQDDVADLGVLAQILERRLVLVERDLLRIADLSAPGAKAAVSSADRTYQKKSAVRIAMGNVRHRRVAVLIERIDNAVDDMELLDGRDVLVPHRIADFLDLLQRRWRDAHLEVVESRLQPLDVDDVVPELVGQLLEGRDALIPDDLLPIAHACTTPAP